MAPNAPPVGTCVTRTRSSGQPEERGHLAAVVPDALALGVDLERAVAVGHGERGLGLEEGVLDELGAERLRDHVGRGRRERRRRRRAARARPRGRCRPRAARARRRRATRTGRSPARAPRTRPRRAPPPRGPRGGVSAATAAITSPTYAVTSPSATSWRQSRLIEPCSRSPGTSAAVRTATTPGAASAFGRVDPEDRAPAGDRRSGARRGASRAPSCRRRRRCRRGRARCRGSGPCASRRGRCGRARGAARRAGRRAASSIASMILT